jgi:hypothetical protein
MATQTAYFPADETTYGYWTFWQQRPNWTPNCAIGNTIDATTAPAQEAIDPRDPRSSPGIQLLVQQVLGIINGLVPANTNQGFLAWKSSPGSDMAGDVPTPTTVTSDPAGGNDTLGSADRFVEVHYDDVTDLIVDFAAHGWTGGVGDGAVLLRKAIVVAHWTAAGGSSAWDRNTTP